MIHGARPLGAQGGRGPALLTDDLWLCDLATRLLFKETGWGGRRVLGRISKCSHNSRHRLGAGHPRRTVFRTTVRLYPASLFSVLRGLA